MEQIQDDSVRCFSIALQKVWKKYLKAFLFPVLYTYKPHIFLEMSRNKCFEYFLISCLHFFVFIAVGQEPKSILEYSALQGSYGIDNTQKIIVWNYNKVPNRIRLHKSIIRFGTERFRIKDPRTKIAPNKVLKVMKDTVPFTIYFTDLPLIHIQTERKIVDDPKIICQLQYFDKDSLITSLVGVEYRGNISLSFPKKSYDLEFWKDSIGNDSKKLKFGTLRKDDDWVLDGLYDEPLRIRSFLAKKIWLEMHEPYYLDKEPKAKSGTDIQFVEVFLNDCYQGLHLLSEQVDRKLLRLQKKEGDTVRGELFKAGAYQGGPNYTKIQPFKNIFPDWAGYEMKYPYEDYTAHWNNIYEFTDFVINATDADFIKTIARKFVLKNAIDYFLFINLLRATDNMGKNFYVARYDDGEPYFNIPWDLDGVFGTIIDGRQIPTTNDILSNGLFDRLWKTDADGYRQRVIDRWIALRKKQWSTKLLVKNVHKYHDKFQSQFIYQREALVWKNTFTTANLHYLTSWMQRRLDFLDQYFEEQNAILRK